MAGGSVEAGGLLLANVTDPQLLRVSRTGPREPRPPDRQDFGWPTVRSLELDPQIPNIRPFWGETNFGLAEGPFVGPSRQDCQDASQQRRQWR